MGLLKFRLELIQHMKKQAAYFLLLALTQTICTHFVIAGEVVRMEEQGVIKYTGVIETGDLNKIMLNAQHEIELPTKIIIDSPGGAIAEAVNIGAGLRGYRVFVEVDGNCGGSCVFIFIAGASRSTNHGLGLYRPGYELQEDYYDDLTPEDIAAYEQHLEENLPRFLEQWGMPDSLIAKIMATSEDKPYQLSREQVEQWIPERPPEIYEWLIAECGYATLSDKVDCEREAVREHQRKMLSEHKGAASSR